MRQRKDDEYRDLKRAAKAEGIEINSMKFHPITHTDIPSEHQDQFKIIQQLGRKTLSNFDYVPNNDTLDRPWQPETKRRAVRLHQIAVKCRNQNLNESGWRHAIEPRLFERFDIEVACKLCRKRLWRSEIEVNPATSNSRTSSLVERQKRRQVCKCKPNGRMDDYATLDAGLSDLFSARIEEPCIAPDGFSLDPKKRPDRIHGLQQSKNFDVLLQSPYSHDETPHEPPRMLEQVIKTSINPDNGGTPLLFPFLLCEAKREKGTENFEQMETQTSFPIRNALRLQYDLLKVPGNSADVPGGPLVWFLANRGEDWRMYAGYVQEKEGRLKYRINYLWSGSITGINDALQLVLIIDYIVDWARDSFRPNIIRQLKSLTNTNFNDSITVMYEPDDYSVAGEKQAWMLAGQDIEPEEIYDASSPDEDIESTLDVQVDPLDQYRTMDGVVRDSRQIHSRLKGLFLTPDNLDTVLQSFENPNQATRFCRSIVALLSRRCVALESEDVLDAVEEQWTGHSRLRPPRIGPKSKVYVQFRLSYYVTPSWEQVRELTYLATTEEARELLIQRSAQRTIVRRSKFKPPEWRSEDLICTLKETQQHDVRLDLISALCRRTYRFDNVHVPQYWEAPDYYGGIPFDEPEKTRPVIEQDTDKSSPCVQMYGTVHAMFEKHRIGSREPNEPFLRASTRLDFEGRPLWKGWQPGDSLPSSRRYPDTFLVYADVPDAKYLPEGSRQKYCLFIMDGKTDSLSNFAIATKLIWALFKEETYATIRRTKVPRDRRNWQDNRSKCLFSMDQEDIRNAPKIDDLMKISRKQFRQDVFGWIKATAVDPPSDSVPMTSLGNWYFSKEAVTALNSGADVFATVCTASGRS